jgi:hypothetical protein
MGGRGEESGFPFSDVFASVLVPVRESELAFSRFCAFSSPLFVFLSIQYETKLTSFPLATDLPLPLDQRREPAYLQAVWVAGTV